jgi:hypothetical protein
VGDNATVTALRPASEIIETARAILRDQRAHLAPLIREPGVQLILLGGSSLPGAVTKGDVDLHLRTPPRAFAGTVELLRGVYRVVHPQIWQPTLATFETGAALPTGIAVTPFGSEHDLRFTRAWQRLATDPEMLRAYNELKVAAADDAEAYERRKSAFFDRLA